MKPLNFIHISRTGGQCIIQTGVDNELPWLRYKDYHKPFPLLSVEEKDAYDWFTAVRNPYARVISDYAWCQKQIFFDPRMEEKDYFNEFLVKWIKNLKRCIGLSKR